MSLCRPRRCNRHKAPSPPLPEADLWTVADVAHQLGQFVVGRGTGVLGQNQVIADQLGQFADIGRPGWLSRSLGWSSFWSVATHPPEDQRPSEPNNPDRSKHVMGLAADSERSGRVRTEQTNNRRSHGRDTGGRTMPRATEGTVSSAHPSPPRSANLRRVGMIGSWQPSWVQYPASIR